MAHQTHGAVDSLLGLLSNAIKDEAKLLSGVQGDIQFIKDEMDSMNGFLLHMTKTEMDHNDQHRAWMKQVRDIADIAQDCILLYMDLSPPNRGLWDLVRHVPVLLWTMPARHRLATKIRELKVRVREVGERRLRYGVTVPEDKDKQLKRSKPAGQDDKDIDKRKGFLDALGPDDVQETTPPPPHEPFNNAIELLPASQYSDKTKIRFILENCMPDVHTSKMFLCALHAYPYGTKEELEKLEKLKDGEEDHVRNEVMIFCYSKLSTHYKSCLQYLTAFHEETSISRTSLVRRWVAEGLVAREEGKTPEEAAERCFNELVFRGFVRPFETGDAGKVKSCRTRKDHNHSVRVLWDFIDDISRSENFVAGLPIHLDRQLQIRKIVQRKLLQQKPRGAGGRSNAPWNICGLSFQTKAQDESAGDSSTTADSKDPMDEMVDLLKSLPEEYRLNVLDLGGCTGLKKRHLKSICKVRSLKYLSLRNTDVSRLPKQINNLRQLETLDIRQTQVRPTDTEHIFLPKLKHLLADPIDGPGDANESLSTVRMPRKIGRNTEILCHVQVLHGEVELEQVGDLKQLRKLGVVLDGSDDNIKHLLRAISKLSKCLRSLSVWIVKPPPALVTEGVSLNKAGDAAYSPPKKLESLNIHGNIGNAGLPTWIHSLTNLSKVTLCETSMSSDNALRILGNLQGLSCLRLRRNSCTDSRLTFINGEFQKLKFLLIEASTSASGSGITFQDDAAPMLQKIVWWSLTGEDDIIRTDTISGITDLPCLEEVELKGCHFNSRPYPLEKEIDDHPNHPALIYPLKAALGTTDEKREDFLRALEDDHKSEAPPSFEKAIDLLPSNLASEAKKEIQDILEKCVPDHVDSLKMLLRALYSYPYGAKEDLKNLEKKLKGRAADVRNEVMIFSYSKLSTHYKSCLQYLTAFLSETSISRTSLVRRWAADGLVARDVGLQTTEEASERCFNELVFRGFVCPVNPVDVRATGKVKSCRMDPSIRDFIVNISKSENFVADLPTHLHYQLEIRKIVQRQPQQPQKKPWLWNICDLGGVPRKSQDDSAGNISPTADSKHPMDDMVYILKSLPEGYRLNVLDLGGCRGLKKRHLKSICKVRSLKYLSLRNTDVSRLPKQINNLRQLETLDIRQTQVRPTDTEHIFLPKLKHLLAGHIDCPGDANESLSTVRMPRKVGRNTEILCHVQVMHGEVELEQVGYLKQLRKLGVVLDGSDDNIKHLLRAIDRLSGRLRSLSVWITQPLTDGSMADLDSKKEMGDATIFSPPTRLQSLNIKTCRLPSWIEDLKELAKITLRDTQLTENGLRKLGKLQGLRCLRLRHSSYTEAVLTLQKEEFQNLKFLLIEVSITARITFDAGAAPKLEKIVWTFERMEITSDTISGISNLPSLKEFELNGDCNTDPVRHAIAGHPNFPVFNPNPRVQCQEARNAGAAATP